MIEALGDFCFFDCIHIVGMHEARYPVPHGADARKGSMASSKLNLSSQCLRTESMSASGPEELAPSSLAVALWQ